jgi:5-methylcytosine-specific restriction endonuclease McrA
MPAFETALVGAVLLLVLLVLVRRLQGRRYAYGWTARFITSPEFLRTPEWRRIRYDVLRANDGRCELCGRNEHQLADGEYLCVDHIHSRKARPDLALEITNLAVLCTADNAGKGNRYADDWRHPAHLHRQRSRT